MSYEFYKRDGETYLAVFQSTPGNHDGDFSLGNIVGSNRSWKAFDKAGKDMGVFNSRTKAANKLYTHLTGKHPEPIPSLGKNYWK
jgi:hypothetical protein